MSARYRVACSCGQYVSVGDAQAGSNATCGCGATVAVPKLRDLRHLPVDNAAPIEARPAPPWDARKAVLFVCGAITLLLLAATVILAVGRSQLDISFTLEEQKLVDDEVIDQLEPIAALMAFYEFRNQGIGTQQPTPPMRSRGSYEDLTHTIRHTSIATAVAAVVWGIVALVMRRRPSR